MAAKFRGWFVFLVYVGQFILKNIVPANTMKEMKKAVRNELELQLLPCAGSITKINPTKFAPVVRESIGTNFGSKAHGGF